MVGCSFLALTKGDPNRILTPYDSDGNMCGMPDQCSNEKHVFPQGEKCPAKFKYQGESTEEAVLTRDFTNYPFKYFPLTDI